jgi:hypothetical protein
VTAPLFIIGAGGFGREVFSIIESLERSGSVPHAAGFIDDAPSAADLERVNVLGSRVVGSVNDLIRRTEPFSAISNPAFGLLQPKSDRAVLYMEKIWLAERCRTIQIPIHLANEWVVIHQSHASTGALSTQARYRFWKRASWRSRMIRLRPSREVL